MPEIVFVDYRTQRQERAAEAWNHGHPPRDVERERMEIAARIHSPKRSTRDQEDAAHLPLFIAANEKELPL